MTLAHEFAAAYAAHHPIPVPPSAREGGLDLSTAYAVAAELIRMRRAAGHRTVGRKVGIANKAMWRALGLKTLVWGAVYDDTVQYAKQNEARFELRRAWAPKIEPEIVFKMRMSLGAGPIDEAAALDAVDWMALGFEIIDCPFPDWKFKPPDFVASYGFHTALMVGEPLQLKPEMIPALIAQLPAFTVKLTKNGAVAAEGSGNNVLHSPALCLAELAAATAQQTNAEPLGADELVSTGTLAEPQRIGFDEVWTATVEGLDLPPLTVRT